ncbi:MAG: hypothetical protein AAF485_27455, partial [Chloroflexota bacterium]
MITISGYHVTEEIYESVKSRLYRAYRQGDQQAVILKRLKNPYPSSEEIAWFKREYEVTHSLNLPGVIDIYGLETDQQWWTLVIEDFGGHDLSALDLTHPEALKVFFDL